MKISKETKARYRKVLRMRRKTPPVTYKEIGDELEVTRGRAYQIYVQALLWEKS